MQYPIRIGAQGRSLQSSNTRKEINTSHRVLTSNSINNNSINSNSLNNNSQQQHRSVRLPQSQPNIINNNNTSNSNNNNNNISRNNNNNNKNRMIFSSSYPSRNDRIAGSEQEYINNNNNINNNNDNINNNNINNNNINSNNIPILEGPLPAEIREIIYTYCSNENAELAEKHARRLISTNRRVRVYREELQIAKEEVKDISQLIKRHETIQNVLHNELNDLNIKIEQLLQEKKLCEMQIQQERELQEKKEIKLLNANERVNVLGNTVDIITKESLTGYLLLRQLVPNLNVENYIA